MSYCKLLRRECVLCLA